MGFMTLNRQLVNLEPKLAEIFSCWDTTAVRLGRNMGKTWGEICMEYMKTSPWADLTPWALALQNPSP